MKIKVGVIVAAVVFGTGILLDNSLMRLDPVAGFATSAQELSGKEVFAARCARCHGDNGEGGKGPNLTTPKKKAKWNGSDAGIVKQVTKGGLIMPAFGRKLSAEQIQAVASYVRTLPPVASK